MAGRSLYLAGGPSLGRDAVRVGAVASDGARVLRLVRQVAPWSCSGGSHRALAVPRRTSSEDRPERTAHPHACRGDRARPCHRPALPRARPREGLRGPADRGAGRAQARARRPDAWERGSGRGPGGGRGSPANGPSEDARGPPDRRPAPSGVEELATHLATWSGDEYVFASPGGGPLRVINWRRRFWRPAVGSAGVEPLSPHDLRHTAVSLWIAAGANPKEVARRAGHTSVAFTLDRYGHLFPGYDEELGHRLDAMFRGGRAAPRCPRRGPRVPRSLSWSRSDVYRMCTKRVPRPCCETFARSKTASTGRKPQDSGLSRGGGERI